jgi:hypothetical protein
MLTRISKSTYPGYVDWIQQAVSTRLGEGAERHAAFAMQKPLSSAEPLFSSTNSGKLGSQLAPESGQVHEAPAA